MSKVKNSLLLLTQTLADLKPNVKHLLEESFKRTKNNLFIYINPVLGKVLATSTDTSSCEPAASSPLAPKLIIEDRFQFRAIINNFYQSSNRLDPNVNVFCLLHDIHQSSDKSSKRVFKLNYDLVLTDTGNLATGANKQELNVNLANFLSANLPNAEHPEANVPFHVIECPATDETTSRASSPSQIAADVDTSNFDLIAQNRVYENSIIGGTFDRLHIGHKMLLSECVLLTRNRLLVGMADGPLLTKKKLTELIQDLEVRSLKVKEFLDVVAPTLDLVTPPIHDPYGPSITERDYQCLIVSQETVSGGAKVNEKRVENNLPLLDVHVIGLVKEDEAVLHENQGDEEKVSSSNIRRHLLGTLLKPPYAEYDPTKPYVVGLTGGLASGKSNIRKDLENMGVATIDCDKLGHKTYEKDTSAYKQLVETFGQDIVAPETGEIDRKALGKKVFGASSELKKLTDIVWPEIERLLHAQIEQLFVAGNRLVVVEAAVLIEAGWHTRMNEVWVTFVNDEEATRRAVERDGSSLEKIQATLAAQLSNKKRLAVANVALCSLWDREYTIKQVAKALDLLKQRTTVNFQAYSKNL